MDAADVWGRSSSSSSSAAARRLQARYDLYMGFDDADAGGDEAVDPRGGAELYNCPFCGEDFDFVSLCCHIDDEHAVEAKSGVGGSECWIGGMVFSMIAIVGKETGSDFVLHWEGFFCWNS
ncbi:hypothetical protein BAE44_0025459 [Dichanthelium oligosanthes]|uniref:Di19 zinc-binding domain-containing protein n=1 Tax=Dichanthelium oligosanthes TaxID=888268 RepID=A0A1E5UKY0_9POAL|nr:hypothetical protein BAE44_0025459 [Dichanthelium oligosanthes]